MPDDTTSLYEQDFYAWTNQQAALLRAGKLAAADIDHIAEEIESMGKSERRELESRLTVLLLNLLKWQLQPGLRSNLGRLTIKEQRRKTVRHLAQNPSLKAEVTDVLADAYGDAVIEAERETGLPEASFPDACPWVFDRVTAEDFWPGDEVR